MKINLSIDPRSTYITPCPKINDFERLSMKLNKYYKHILNFSLINSLDIFNLKEYLKVNKDKTCKINLEIISL